LDGSLFENHGSYAGLSVAMVSVPAVWVLSESGVQPARPAAGPDDAPAEDAGTPPEVAGLETEALLDPAALDSGAALGAALETGAGLDAGAAELVAGAAAVVDEDPQADTVRAVAAPSATRRARGRRWDMRELQAIRELNGRIGTSAERAARWVRRARTRTEEAYGPFPPCLEFLLGGTAPELSVCCATIAACRTKRPSPVMTVPAT
jgi:hypothetical protein